MSNDISLSDMRGGAGISFNLENGARSIGQSFISEEPSSVTIRGENKRIGEFDEQNDWKGGRGGERFSLDKTKYLESKDAWTLSPNHVIPTLQWRFARGLRSEDFSLAGDKEWKPLLGATRFISVSFTASASYTTAHTFAWIRRRGTPGTLTYAIYSDTSDEPNASLANGTTTSFDDILSVLHDFEVAQALTSGTKYHVVLAGASTDTSANYWEVAAKAVTLATSNGYTSTTGTAGQWTQVAYEIHYRLTAADVVKRWWLFEFHGATYAVDQKAAVTASSLYINGARGTASGATGTTLVDTGIGWTADRWIGAYVRIVGGTGVGQIRAITDNTTDTLSVATWDKIPDATSEYVIHGTEYWSEIGSTGLGAVVGRPVSANGVVYFPQGASVNIRKMQLSSGAHAFGDSGTNKANVLVKGRHLTSGPQIWRALANDVSYATVVDWASDLSFGTDLPCGDTEYDVTNLVMHNGKLYAFKADSVYDVAADVIVTNKEYGIKGAPHSANGRAAVSHRKFLYFNWQFSTEQEYETGFNEATLTDVGQGWADPALPDGREGIAGSYESYIAWLFEAKDAGAGTSSVFAYDGYGWHEIVRAYGSGRRIREVKMQSCEGTRNRLWWDCGGDIMFNIWPDGKANPLYDSGVAYQHEAVIESSAIDMGTAARLPKFISSLVGFTKNLKSGITVGVSFQTDEDVGSNTWTEAGAFTQSPEDEVAISAANVGRFAYRLILNTNDENTPPDITGVIPSGFARSPFRLIWNIRIKIGEGFTKDGRKADSMEDILEWLYDGARYPGVLKMFSDKYTQMNNKYVIVIPPEVNPTAGATIGKEEKAILSLKLMEV